MFRKFLKPLCVALTFSAFSDSGFALDESRLWLPSNHERLYLDLKAAALAAESLERCQKVIRATLNTSQSRKNHPIFMIQCRQANGRTYNEMVDGVTKETLTTPVVVEVPITGKELEIQRLEEERLRLKALDDRKQLFFTQCRTKFDEKTLLFIEKRILNEHSEPEEFTMEKAKYYFDFDALDINGKALEYRAICVTSFEGVTQLYIRKRRS